MKKILFCFLIVFCFATLTVEANSGDNIEKPIVFVKGFNYQKELNYSGYAILSNNVNFNLAGNYEVVYEKNGQTFKKPVTIVEQQEVMNEGFLLQESQNIYKLGENEQIIKYHSLDGNQYIMTKNEHVYRLIIINESKLIENIVLSEDENLTLTDFLIYNNEIYFVGNYYVNLSTDVYLLKYNFEKSSMDVEIYGGSQTDIAKTINLLNDKIIITGYTNSMDGCFYNKLIDFDGFILEIELDTMFLIGTSNITTEFDSKITFSEVLNNSLYLIHEFKDSRDENYKSEVIIFDSALNEINRFIIGSNKTVTVNKLLVKDDKVFLLLKEYNYLLNCYENKVFTLNNRLQLIYKKIIPSNQNESMKDLLYINNKLVVLLQVIKNSTLDTSYLLDVSLKQHLFIEQSIVRGEVLGLTSDDLSVMVLEKNLLAEKNNFYLKANNLNQKIIENNQEQKNYVEVDFKKVPLSDKSVLTANSNCFGEYVNYYYYEGKSFDFAYYLNVFVPENFSVKDQETYDLFTKLSFNGHGYLNGVEIDSGFVIDKKGTYQLEVLGNKGEIRTLSFEITNTALSSSSRIFEDVSFDKINLEISSKDKQIVTSGEIKEKYTKENYIYWSFILPIFSILVVSLMSITKRGV